jgi:hypothetical protein
MARDRTLPSPTREAEVHRGDSSSVWQGRDDGGRLVAVKVLHPDAGRRARRRLLDQARRARAVGHRRVLAPVAVRTERRGTGTVWPWIPGRDLAGRISRHGRLDPTWASAIADEVDGIVTAMHQRGLIHGRLTAGHVLLDQDGRPVLTALDPVLRDGPAARAADRRAAAAIRALLFGADPTTSTGASGPEPGSPGLAPGGPPSALRRRAPLAVVAGLVVMTSGTAMVRVGSDPGSACPSGSGPIDLRVDVDGDGCEDDLEWSSTTGRLVAETTSGSREWRLGEPGDRFVLGDWDCDGVLTGGVRRPRTGRTYGFDRWPTDRAAVARPVDPDLECPHPTPTSRSGLGQTSSRSRSSVVSRRTTRRASPSATKTTGGRRTLL